MIPTDRPALPPAAASVLEALVIGFQLRENDGAWSFLDSTGRKSGEPVSGAVFSALADCGFVSVSGSSANISELGKSALNHHIDSGVLEWLTGRADQG
jgi:hypothetical protein